MLRSFAAEESVASTSLEAALNCVRPSSLDRPPQLLHRRHSSPLVPPLPPSQPDRLLALPPPLLCYVLSFVSSYYFYFRLPFLSRRHQWQWTDERLQRREAERRLSFTPLQWRQFHSQAWPRLHVAVHEFALHPLYSSVCDDWREDDDHRDQGQRWSADPQLDADSGAHRLRKDWALECRTLYQHLHLAQRMLTRSLPEWTSRGHRLRYVLPPTLIALLVDRLTARHCVDWVRCGDREEDLSMRDKVLFLALRYDNFQRRQHPLQPTALRIDAQTPSWPPYNRRPPRPSPLPVPSRSSAALESSAVEVAALWMARRGEDEWVEELGQLLNDHLKDEKAVRRDLPELLPLAEDDDVAFPVLHALWIGPQLRRAVDEAHGMRPTAGGAEVEVEVALDGCPVVQVPLRRSYWTAEPYPLPRLLAPSVAGWMEGGGLRDWNQSTTGDGDEQRTVDGARRVKDWLASRAVEGGEEVEELLRGIDARKNDEEGQKVGTVDELPESSFSPVDGGLAELTAEWWRMLRRAAAVMRCRGCGHLLAEHSDHPPLLACDL